MPDTNIISKKIILYKYIFMGFVAIIAGALRFSGPIVLKIIIQNINAKDSFDFQFNITLAVIWLFLIILKSILDQYSVQGFFWLSLKFKGIITMLIHKKLCNLSINERNKINGSKMMSSIEIDGNPQQLVKLITKFFMGSPSLFASPLVLIAAQVLLFNEVNWISFLYSGTLVFVMSLQMVINKKMFGIKNMKIFWLQTRTNYNTQFMNNMQEIKNLGWEQLIVNSNQQLRSKQNQHNFNQSIWRNIYQLIIVVTPSLIVASIILSQILTQGLEGINVAKIYSIVSLVGLTSRPLRTMVQSFNAAYQASKRYKNLDKNILKLQQMENINQSKEDSQVTVITKQSILTWDKDYAETQDEIDSRNLQGQGKKQVCKMQVCVEKNKLGKRFTVISNSKPFFLKLNFIFEKGNRYIVLGKANSGKSSLLRSILGHMHLIQGQIQFKGKIAYGQQKPWLKYGTLQENIIFESQYDMEWYWQVIKICLLREQFRLLEKGDQFVYDDGARLSKIQIHKIALARTIYSKADIYLLDDPLQSMDAKTAHEIYQTVICELLMDKLVIMSSSSINYINPHDYSKPFQLVLLMVDGAIHHNYFEELQQQKEENDILQEIKNKNNLDIDQQQRRIQQEQRIMKQKRFNDIKVRVMRGLRTIYLFGKGKAKADLCQIFDRQSQQVQQAKKKQAQQKRVQGVLLKQYKSLFATASNYLYILLILVTMVSVGANYFGDYTLGTLGNKKTDYQKSTNIIIVIVLNLLYAITQGIAGIFTPYISIANTEASAQLMIKTMAYATPEYFRKEPAIKNAQRLSRVILFHQDNYQIFQMNNFFEHILRGLFGLIGVLVLGCLVSFYFGIIFLFVGIINIVITINFLKTVREIFDIRLKSKHLFYINQISFFQGAFTIKAYQKQNQFTNKIQTLLFNQLTATANFRGIFFSVNILNSILSTIIIGGTTFFAILSRKDISESTNIALTAASISFALKSTQILSQITGTIVNIEISARKYWKKHLQFKNNIGTETQLIFRNQPNIEWPSEGIIEFKRVKKKFKGSPILAISQSSILVEPRQFVSVVGKSGNGKSVFLKLLAGKIEPTQGEVLIDSENIYKIGRAYTCQRVMLLSDDVFIMQGKLRMNVDPFGQFTDFQVQKALNDAELFNENDEINNGNEYPFLQQKITQNGENLDRSTIQQINLARVFLVKLYYKFQPKIILLDKATSSISEEKEDRIINRLINHQRKPTIFKVSLQSSARATKIVVLKNKIVQYDCPINLIKKEKGALVDILKQSNIYNKELCKFFQNIIEDNDYKRKKNLGRRQSFIMDLNNLVKNS